MRDLAASGQLDELGGRKAAGSAKILRSHNDVDDEARPAPGTRLQAARPEPCPHSLIRTTDWPKHGADRLATGPFQAQLRTAVALPEGNPRSRRSLAADLQRQISTSRRNRFRWLQLNEERCAEESYLRRHLIF